MWNDGCLVSSTKRSKRHLIFGKERKRVYSFEIWIFNCNVPHCLARGASTKENTSKATSLAKGRWFHTKNLCSTLYAMGHRNIVLVCKLQGLEDSERLRGWYSWDYSISTRLHYHYDLSNLLPLASPRSGRGHVLRRWVLGRQNLKCLAPLLWPLPKSSDLQGLKTWNGQVHLARWKVLWWRMAASNSAPTCFGQLLEHHGIMESCMKTHYMML